MSPNPRLDCSTSPYNRQMSNKPKLDDTDRAILLQLSEDGRLSNTELARRVGLTPAPCLRRVQRLERDGVIAGYRAVLDPTAAGRPFEVVVAVEITFNDRQTVVDFEAAITSYDEVTEVLRLFGLPDYYLRVNVADSAAYEGFIMNKLSTLKAVNRIVSHQNMKTLKKTT
ncbi:Lrp/AsnC family transcriptional regulator [Actinosynnema pretiosum]|nr:Lrp/AsnC family transcriptional regulator [Actinosynnema pretiosum]